MVVVVVTTLVVVVMTVVVVVMVVVVTVIVVVTVVRGRGWVWWGGRWVCGGGVWGMGVGDGCGVRCSAKDARVSRRCIAHAARNVRSPARDRHGGVAPCGQPDGSGQRRRYLA